MWMIRLVLFFVCLATAVWMAWPKTLGRDLQWSIRRFVAAGVLMFVGLPICWALLSGIVFVPAGSRGLVLRFGAVTGRVLGEGINVVTPFAEEARILDIQVHKVDSVATASSKDLQNVTTKVTLNYFPKPESVGRLYQEVGYEHETRIIPSSVQEAVKAATAQFNAEHLVTERPAVRTDIETRLRQRLSVYGLVVDAVQITDFSFSAQFSHAIELKVTAVQRALEAQNDLERIKAVAAQTIESAKAQAESLRLQRDAVSKDLIELRRIELQEKALQKWNGALPTYITNDSPVPVIDLFKKN